jgi:SMI1/KNR4 family protein SUKH-1
MTPKRPFDGFDFEGFWADGPYSLENYVEPPPSDELIASIEQELGGYRLPAAYVDLARRHNGGLVKRNCHPMKERTGWAEDHVAITGLYAIGRTSKYSLAGQLGAKFMIEKWGYPPIGVGIAGTPAGGHELICWTTGPVENGASHRSCTSTGRMTTASPSLHPTSRPSFEPWSRSPSTTPPRRTGLRRSQPSSEERYHQSWCGPWRPSTTVCRTASGYCPPWAGRSWTRRASSPCGLSSQKDGARPRARPNQTLHDVTQDLLDRLDTIAGVSRRRDKAA